MKRITIKYKMHFSILALFCIFACIQSAQAQITNYGFETGNFAGWSASSGTSISTGTSYNQWTVNPADSYMATIDPNSGLYRATVESTLGLQSGALVASNASLFNTTTNFATLKQQFVLLAANQTVSIYWNFIARDYAPFNDGAIATLVGPSYQQIKLLAVTANAYGDAGAVVTGSYGSAGWHKVSFTSGVAGTYTLGFASFNTGDQILSPILIIDNAPGGNFQPGQPIILTTAVSSVGTNSAVSGGNVTSDGGATVTARGVCWNTAGSPTITDAHTSDGTGLGSFVSNVTGLSQGTTYYLRAYAINSAGTVYGGQVTFTTVNPIPANPTSISVSANPICNGTSTQLTANGALGTVYWYTGSCGGTFVGTGNAISVSPGTTTTYYARNFNSGLFSSGCASTTITVNSAPTISCPSNLTVSNTSGQCGANVTFPSATVTGSPTPTISYSQASGSFFPVGTTTVTATATNSCGSASCTFNVTVTDNENPSITCPPAVTLSANSGTCSLCYDSPQPIPTSVTLSVGARVNTYSGVSVNGGGNSAVVSPGSSVSLHYQMSAYVDYNGYCPGCVTQAYIGIGGTSQTINCHHPINNGYSSTFNGSFTAPTTPGIYYLTQSGSLQYSCVPVGFNNDPNNAIAYIIVGNAGLNIGNPVTSDNCGVASVTNNAPSCFPIGMTAVTWTVTDIAGNSSTCVQNVTVIENQPPTVLTQNVTVQLNASGVAIISASQINNGSTDNCGIASLALSKTSFDCSNIGANAVTLTVTDVNGNVASGNAIVTIQDQTIPVINCVGNQTIASCTNALPDYTTGATVSDNCGSGGITMTQSPAAGTSISSGATVSVTLTARDASNNSATCTFTVTRPNITPVANNDAVTLCAGSSITFNVLGNDSHPQGAALTVSDNTNPSVGTLVKNPDNSFTYTSVTPSSSPVTFSYIIKANDGVIPFAGNNHYYEWVPANGITWLQAKAQAATKSFNGMQGYLVTVTSAAEMAFVNSKIQGQGWMGASDLASEGTWRWVTGPEGMENGGLGRHFSNQFKTGNCSANTAPGINGNYANWGGGEPNDCGANIGQFAPTDPNRGGEHYAHFYGGGIWNDYPNSVGAITGYIVEYGGLESCTPVLTATATVTITVNPKPVLSAVTTNVMCVGGNNGAIDLSVSSGQTPFTYNWSNGASTQDVNNLPTGTYTVTVTTADGCSTQGSYTINQVDNVPPVALAKNVTVQLDDSGNGSTTAALVNNGSSDACGIKSMVLSKSAFNCADISTNPNVVTLTVTDNNNNVSTTTVEVTVVDATAPTAVAQNVTVQLDATGHGSTTAALVNNGSNDACGIASLTLSKTAFDCSNVGSNNVTLTVTDVNGNVSTTPAIVTVQDKVAPVAIARNVTIQLNAAGAASITAAQVNNGSSDACGVSTMTLSKTVFDCSNVGPNPVTLTVTDVNGNVSTVPAIVTVQDKVTPIVVAKNITVQLDATGNATIAEDAVNDGSSDACGGLTFDTDITSFTCSNVGSNTVTLKVTDKNGNFDTKTAVVTVQDKVPPVAIAQNVTVQLDATGNGSTTAALVNNGSTDACGIATLALSKTTFDCGNVGSNNVTLTVTDVNGNVSTAPAIITVQDKVAPVAIAQDVIVQLDATGNGSTTAALVNNGSNDACGIATLALSKTTFDCGNVGSNNVTLTVTDVNGNVSTAPAIVTVQDKVPPVAIAQDVTVQLDATGNGSTTAALVNNGSTDACGIATLALSKTTFDCSNVGPNNVILTVTDVNGNVSTAPAVVTVQDKVPPIAIAQDVTVQLDATGNGSTTAALVNNGSTDACGIATLALSKTTFDCSNVGTNPVILTVTDVNGNVSTAGAVVTVQDKVVPVITCKTSTSRYIDPYQTYYTVVDTEFDATATDACGVKFLTYLYNGLESSNFPSLAGMHLNVGTHTFVWTAVDVNGNESECTTVVTVLKRPTTLTYNGDVYEQYSDQADLSATLIDNVSGFGVHGKTILFTIGTQSVTAVTDENGLAKTTLILDQSPLPAFNVVTAFVEDGSYLGSVDNDGFDIIPEDARVNFTGTQLVATQSSTSGFANVTLRATVQDITAVTGDLVYDAFAGDIRNARVRFIKDGVVLTDWLTPTLVNNTDLKIGVVSYNWSVNIGTATDEEYTIGIEVGTPGYYLRYDQSDNTVVTVYKPVGDFITGGGYILPTSSAGTYAADAGLKTNFGFNVGYNKSGKNIHGNMNIIFRRAVGGIIHTYQIKANAMTSLGVNIANPAAQTAVFVSKANLKDITNPLAPVSLGGNLTLQVNLTDRGEPGSSDQIAISLYDGSTLMNSSNWTGIQTAELTLTGGNLVVHSGFSLTTNKSAKIEPVIAPEIPDPYLKVYPNPFNDRVRFEFISPEAVNAQIDIFDLNGRLVETIFKSPVESNVLNNAEFKSQSDIRVMYMYRVTLGSKVYTGKVLYGNN
jgi:hypothetical protein